MRVSEAVLKQPEQSPGPERAPGPWRLGPQPRAEAQRQQVYLERIAQPSLPDVAQEPRRMRSILSTFLLGLMAWGILSMLVAGVREHQD